MVKDHISSTLPDTLDPLQFASRPNRSTDDAITIALHTTLSHLDKRNTYVRMLFIAYSSAFNTIVPFKLDTKLKARGMRTICNWILDFLTGRPQVVRVGNNTSATLTLNTGAPYGCMLSPLLCSLWYQGNSLSLSVSQTKELIVDYRKQGEEPYPIVIDRFAVERVKSSKFLSVHITENLTWSDYTTTVGA